MREDDRQLGQPMRAYQETKANIEAMDLGGDDEGCVAYAADTDEFGTFNGTTWTWGFGAGRGNPVFRCDGRLKVTLSVGGAYIVTGAAEVSAVYIHCRDAGEADSTIVDVNLNDVTVFTAQGNRPTLAWDDADGVAKSGTPDVTTLAENDILTVDIDEVALKARNLVVVVAVV